MTKLAIALACTLLMLCVPLRADAPDAPGFPNLVATAVADGTGDTQAVAAPSSGTLYLVGVYVTEDAGTPAAAALSVCDGTAACTKEILPITLSASQSTRWSAPSNWGIPLTAGVWIHRTAGSTRMTIVTRVYR